MHHKPEKAICFWVQTLAHISFPIAVCQTKKSAAPLLVQSSTFATESRGAKEAGSPVRMSLRTSLSQWLAIAQSLKQTQSWESSHLILGDHSGGPYSRDYSNYSIWRSMLGSPCSGKLPKISFLGLCARLSFGPASNQDLSNF